jgi:selenoprotein W-related protein
VSLGTELIKFFEPEIESLTLIPSDGGTFEVVVNDRLLYSKLQTRRHAEPGEVVELLRRFIQEGT